MRKIGFFASLIVLFFLISGFTDSNTIYDSMLFKDLKYRCIGPSRGGRVTTVTGIASQPSVFFMGATGGGVWILMDYGDCVIHLFGRQARDYYDLDLLWGDASKVEWQEAE